MKQVLFRKDHMIEIDPNILRRAYEVAARLSDDPDTQNGAVLVDRHNAIISESANCFTRGVAVTPERQQRPAKYDFMVHAERGAVFEAARLGVSAKGGILYVPWYACLDCAQAIVQAGIAAVVGHQQMMDKTPDRWKETIAKADALLDEAGVVRLYHDGQLGGVEVLFNGEKWAP